MRRILPAVIILGLMACPSHVSASAEGVAPPPVVVRVYPDWRTDPKAYVAVTVPLEGDSVKAEAVRREYARAENAPEAEKTLGTGPSEAIVVVMPEDQQDQSVVDAMKDLVFAQLLRQGTLKLQPGQVPSVQQKPYLFVDTAGQPLADAEVAILIGQSEYNVGIERPRVWIADTKLDAEGRLVQPPRSSAPLNRFAFYVMHPDCGHAFATPQYAGADQPNHVFRVAALPKDQWCVFVNALGRPMAGAWVEVITSGSWERGSMTAPAPILLDEGGRLRPPPIFTTLTRCSFVVSDPNSGLALVEPYERTEVSVRAPLKTCIVPLAPGGTFADAGSIRGVVVDSDEIAVPGAVIACTKVVAPDGATLRPYWPWPAQWNKEAKVLTNDRGQFAMCLPPVNGGGTLAPPVPRGSLYEVTITPPAELGCRPFQGRLSAGAEYTITLEGTAAGPKKYEGTLAFEDERGPVTDPQKISRVDLVIRVARGNLPAVAYGYPRGEWLEKSKLPFGLYEAKADWDGKHYTFWSIRVTAESPDVVVFKPVKIERFETRYRGRAVHATSGDPIAGVAIMPAGGQGLDLTDPDAVRRVEQQAGARAVRTDPAGRFEIVLPVVPKPGPEHALLALHGDYLPCCGQRSPAESRTGSDMITLPDLKLFPAGVAVIEPNVPDDHRGKRVLLDFLVADDAPAWLKNLWAPPERDAGGSAPRRTDLAAGARQSLYVPAYTTLTLRLSLPDDRYAPALIENVLVAQGKTTDLGRIDFARTIPVAVKVLDPQGDPLEGVTVTCLAGKGGHPVGEAVTEAGGVARIRVAAHSQGRFVVQYRDPQTKATIREEVQYEVAGAKDTGREFILQLSEEFVKRVLESK